MKKKDNIPGLVGYYISPRGHLYSRFEKSGLLTPRIDAKKGYKPKKWRKLKPNSSQRGYQFHQLRLSGQNKKKAFFVHRLVAMVYLPKPDKSRIEVDHIDNDVSNNRVINLRWVTSKENSRHRFESGHQVSLKMTPDKILEMEKLYSEGVRICELCKIFQVGRTTVRKILNHERAFQNY